MFFFFSARNLGFPGLVLSEGMLLTREFGVRVGDAPSPPAVVRRRGPGRLELWGLDPRPAAGASGWRGGGVEGDCRLLARLNSGERRDFPSPATQIGGLSLESEHDLALMVSDFLENGSSGAESRYSSDSDSGFPDLSHLAEKVLFHKHALTQCESDLLSVTNSLMLSINEVDLYCINQEQCNDSCIRQTLVKLLKLSGYDAALCITRWQGLDKVPGGDHEFIDVVLDGERLIIDIDFRSHFEIARAVESYEAILNELPVVYVGSLPRLKQFLQIMVDATKCSLKQNSMPLPPWRSLSYLQAKWFSKYERKHTTREAQWCGNVSDHKQCIGHMQRLKASLKIEIESELLLPVNKEKRRRTKTERRQSFLLSC